MAANKHQSLEETISAYKSKFLIDLDDDIDDGPMPDDELDDDESSSHTQDLRAEPEDDGSDAKETSRGRKSKLPKDLAGLMGQANIMLATECYEDGKLMCQEVIRLAPRSADPFISLAEHYQNIGDDEKAETLYLIAAYLQPSNSHLWVKVAESATERREFRLAATCLTKAIRADKSESCVSYHLRRCNLYEKLGDQKRALRGYENLIPALGPNDQEFGLELVRGIARIYLAENKVDSCIRTIEGSLDKYSSLLSHDDIAQLCHCYNIKEYFTKTIDIMVQKCAINLKLIDTDDWNLDKMNEALEKDHKLQLKIDLVPKPNSRFSFRNKCLLLVALIELGYHDETITPLIPKLENTDITIHRNSLYELAQAYYSQKKFQNAKEILLKLTKHRDSQVASVWLLYSQCLKNLNEIDESIEAYRKVLTYQPDDYSSRLALSNLYSVQGRLQEALEVTRQPLFTDKPVDIALLHQSCELLAQSEQWDEFCQSAKALMLTDMIYTQHPKEIMCMITSKSFRTRLDNLRFVRRELGNQNRSLFEQKSIGSKLDSSTMLKTFLRYINVLYQIMKDFDELKKICFSAYTCGAFECYESSIDFYTSVACVICEDKDFTYNHLKILACGNPENNQTWNLLGIAMSNIYQDLRHSRFCIRQFAKNPEVLPLALFKGHNELMSGSYKQALMEYMTVFRERPNDPLPIFCIALTFLSLSCQRYVSSKYLCLFQMIAFLHTYLELRGTCQETMFNMGRVFHQMNMLDKAVAFYKRVLTMKPIDHIRCLEIDDGELDEMFDIRREAAFNLALIYKNSSSYGLAYKVIKDNFTI